MKKLVYVVSGGISRYSERRPAAAPHMLLQEACEYAFESLGISFSRAAELIDGVVASHVDPLPHNPSIAATELEHFGFFPKHLIYIKQHDTTGGICFQEAVKQILSYHAEMDICLVYGWETAVTKSTNKKTKCAERLTHINGNTNSALSPIEATNATPEQIAKVSVKNHRNAAHNPYACRRGMIDVGNGKKIAAAELTVDNVLDNATEIAGPFTRLHTCDTSDGAAVCILANEHGLSRLRKAGAKLRHGVFVSGMGQATHTPSLYDKFYTTSNPALASPASPVSNPVQIATHQAYIAAKVTYPFWELDFVELHDSCAPYEIQTYEDLGLCSNGKGGTFIDDGFPFLPSVNYGRAFKEFVKRRLLAVNPSGGLIACGHSGPATALRQIVFSLWQLQETIKDHFGSNVLQVPHARRGIIHSRSETNGIVTVNILER